MEKQTVVYTDYGLLLSNKREWTIDTHNNVDDSQNNYAKSKKPDQNKKDILYDSIYIEL